MAGIPSSILPTITKRRVSGHDESEEHNKLVLEKKSDLEGREASDQGPSSLHHHVKPVDENFDTHHRLSLTTSKQDIHDRLTHHTKQDCDVIEEFDSKDDLIPKPSSLDEQHKLLELERPRRGRRAKTQKFSESSINLPRYESSIRYESTL